MNALFSQLTRYFKFGTNVMPVLIFLVSVPVAWDDCRPKLLICPLFSRHQWSVCLSDVIRASVLTGFCNANVSLNIFECLRPFYACKIRVPHMTAQVDCAACWVCHIGMVPLHQHNSYFTLVFFRSNIVLDMIFYASSHFTKLVDRQVCFKRKFDIKLLRLFVFRDAKTNNF